MISTYLTALYSNCPSLGKTALYNAHTLDTKFNSEISLLLKQQELAGEDELVAALISRSYAELAPVFAASAFIKLFYLVNSLGEYAATGKTDELGRFKFSESVQQHTGITENTVWHIIKETVTRVDFLREAFTINEQKSAFFLSHDIDSMYGSTVQDGMWALKHGRFDVMLTLFANIIMAKPAWFNIDLIMKLESEHDFKSTFYWLVNKCKIDQRQTNSDYSIGSGRLVKQLKKVQDQGFENGLHKSISNETFATELAKLPQAVVGNRFHYLKYQLPAMYAEIEKAGLKLDASLGFAEHYGFRNNYGYPFSPYNFKTKAPYSFLEVPLTLMDGTFQRYMKIPVHKTADEIIGFLEKHKHNALLSLLWHNTFFTDYKYKGYRQEYVKVLQYLRDETFENINQTRILDTFLWRTI